MKILVTGHAGFIGMHVCEALLARGHRVVGIDNFNDYYSVELKRARHARLEAHGHFAGHAGDVCDRETLQRLFANERPDVVCHLAAQAGVRYSLTNPYAYGENNVQGLICVLEACRRHGAGRLVYASSSSVYGGNTKLPFSETDPVEHPVSLYAATKRAGELIAHSYTHNSGLPTVGLRFFSVYGPWGRPDVAMWLFTEAMLQGKPIQVFNHGKMQRDFTYVDDIVKGVVACLEAKDLGPYEIFNIGNHRSEELMRLIELIAAELKVTPQLEFLPMQLGDIPASYADISRIQSRLGFEPSTPIEVGVPKFVDWYRRYHGLHA
jgi:UDP-glucuronate 4-epimerase